MKSINAQNIDALLPQTQCGLCGYGGCMPYANALADESAPINLCPPGGVDTLLALADLLDKSAAPYIKDMQQKAKPEMIAKIREAECIGCTKCIAACPVDAIIGGAKSMHVILTDACTGCELCIPPCPVDCIDMLPITTATTKVEQQEKRDQARNHFKRREMRLQKEKDIEAAQIKLAATQKKQALQSYITDALNRAKNKAG